MPYLKPCTLYFVIMTKIVIHQCLSMHSHTSIIFMYVHICQQAKEFHHVHGLIYSPNGRFMVQETFPKTLLRFVLILISLQRWQHRVRNETKHFVAPHQIGPQFLANQQETNQHKSAALIGLFHATSSVLLSVGSYRNYRKPTQRGVQGYLSSLQRRVGLIIWYTCYCNMNVL